MPFRVVILARLLEGAFMVGSLGSFIVLLLSGIEDIETLFGMNKEEKPS